jgi:hypothetical protein
MLVYGPGNANNSSVLIAMDVTLLTTDCFIENFEKKTSNLVASTTGGNIDEFKLGGLYENYIVATYLCG